MIELEMVLNAMDEGVLIVNKDNKIVYFNDAYGNFIGYTLEEVKGARLTDIRPGAKMPQVLKMKKPMEVVFREEKGEEYFTNIYPIFDNGKLKGGVSTVTFLKNAKFIVDTLKELERKQSDLEERMRHTNGTKFDFQDIVCESPVSVQCVENAKKLAKSDITVLINGESGCGKELYAQSIHNESTRRDYPFVAINCAALSGNMLESELFGYEAGSFTGAKKNGKPGLFEIAEKGTVFLDEVSEMNYNLQAKLLRVLQERKIRRVGGTSEIPIDVRIICACNVDLLRYIEEKRFRKDLYYRISAFPLHLPPLRERREDILPLMEKHLKVLGIQQKRELSISEEAKRILYAYDWPGNVRELNNVLEYSTVVCHDDEIGTASLPPTVLPHSEQTDYKLRRLSEAVRAFEKEQISTAVEMYGDTVESKKMIAKKLGISLATLYNKLNN
ncbi:sigma-54 interaction domain-containing protein [Aminipila luticellarii]|uniref:PAS domain-containing protein n=1 Tax=Aminipila luticellarii TaxID=2507160 RepID=A0A410PT99_9FIRM|nr:sigma 54-interacting transcriptional regulator [Aminipila luticellarii]QAT42143.1 PAS domain-containing protein [Aminipila luticellarii]